MYQRKMWNVVYGKLFNGRGVGLLGEVQGQI